MATAHFPARRAKHRMAGPSGAPAPARPARSRAPARQVSLEVVSGGGPGRRPRSDRGSGPFRWNKVAGAFCSSPIRCTAALAAVSAVVFGLVLLNIHVAQTSFRLEDLQRHAVELQVEQRRLRYEVARAESPEKIVEMSTALGLVPPVAQQYLEGPPIPAAEAPSPAVLPAEERRGNTR